MNVAIVYSFKPSDWFSCTVINKNLRAAYEAYFGSSNILHIDYSHDREFADSDLDKLISNQIKKIIFIDHKPTPIDFMKRLIQKNKEYAQQVEYSLHIFGDFPLYLNEWRALFLLMQDYHLKFLVASKKQKLLLDKFLQQSKLIEVSPFPVDEKKFSFNLKKSEKARLDLGLGREKVFLYTGRLSYQKRIVELITLFLQLLRDKKIEPDSKLILVGAIDSLGVPYLSAPQILGEYYRSIHMTLADYPDFKDNIFLVGKIDNSRLKNYYLAADCFLSTSTYHDEDYGMAVAEALCSGLPAILTDWAGYSSFQLESQPEFCQLVPTKLTTVGPQFDVEAFQQKIMAFKREHFSREEISKVYSETLGINQCAINLGAINKGNFEKFGETSDFMKRITNEQITRGPQDTFRSENNREYNDLYFEAYDVYAE